MELNRSVTGIALKRDEAKVSVIGVQNRPGVAAHLFSVLSENGINIDMIIQSNEEKDDTNTITFTVSQDDFQQARSVAESMVNDMGFSRVEGDTNIAKVSIVGVGMISKPGVAAKMFQALGDAGINIQLITTSEIKVSCAIDTKQADLAVQVLHDVFKLNVD